MPRVFTGLILGLMWTRTAEESMKRMCDVVYATKQSGTQKYY